MRHLSDSITFSLLCAEMFPDLTSEFIKILLTIFIINLQIKKKLIFESDFYFGEYVFKIFT